MEKQIVHMEYIEKLSREKEFKQEMYGIERLIQHEESMQLRQRELEY